MTSHTSTTLRTRLWRTAVGLALAAVIGHAMIGTTQNTRRQLILAAIDSAQQAAVRALAYSLAVDSLTNESRRALTDTSSVLTPRQKEARARSAWAATQQAMLDANAQHALAWSYLRRADSILTGGVPTLPPPDTTPLPPDTTTPPDTATPPDTTTPVPGITSPEPLRQTVALPAGLDTASCTQAIAPSQLQSAVNAAATKTGRSVLCLTPGTLFRGTLRLPKRTTPGVVVIATTPTAGQPQPGARARPSHRPVFAAIEATGTSPAVTYDPGASDAYFRSIEIRSDSSLATLTYALVDFAAPGSQADFAERIFFDRTYVHGWPHRPLRRCFSIQTKALVIENSWVDECHEKGTDSQAIWGASGPGPFRIVNNYLAGAGENVMFGGGDPKFRGVHPADIYMARNHVDTPLSWKPLWTKKNLFELKNAQRVVLEHNVFTGSWPQGQTGVALVIKSSNQGKTAAHRDNGTRDVVIRENLILQSAAALHVMGLSGEAGRYTDSVTRRVLIERNYAETGTDPAYGNDNRGIAIWSQPQHVILRGNTWLSPAGDGSAYNASSTANASPLVIDRDLRTAGRYGFFNCWTGACAPLGLGAALVGTAGPKLPGVVFVSSTDAGWAAGYGVSRPWIDVKVRGVVVPR